jgi:hypothetical protein
LPMMPCTVMSKEFQSLKLQSNGTSENWRYIGFEGTVHLFLFVCIYSVCLWVYSLIVGKFIKVLSTVLTSNNISHCQRCVKVILLSSWSTEGYTRSCNLCLWEFHSCPLETVATPMKGHCGRQSYFTDHFWTMHFV